MMFAIFMDAEGKRILSFLGNKPGDSVESYKLNEKQKGENQLFEV